jgi:glutamyl-tRNA synthetase
VPEFAHTPLILNQEGRKLSKRDGVTSISEFQQMGYTAAAMANYMTLLGWSPPDPEAEIFSLEAAAQQFSFERVNKAGAKFDWDKLSWINSQYLHKMPIPELTELLIPYWQSAGYEGDPVTDRAWLEQLASLIGPSLTRLEDAISLSQTFFVPTVNLNPEAKAQLAQEGAVPVVQGVLEALDSSPSLTEAQAQAVIKQVTKDRNVKKGLVMRSLRAAFMGEMNGPDMLQSWLLLNQRGWDRVRLQQALDQV